MEHKDPRESEESMATTIEAKESLQAQNNAVVTVDVGDKIESSDKYGEGYQSEKHGNGSASEKAREGYLSHESDDTATPNSTETPVNPEEKTNDTQEEEPLPKMKVMLILTAVTAACFIMFLDTSIVSTAIPSITNQFHSLPDIGWYGSAYLLANCALQPMTGKIYSKFNAKWVFMCFLAIFELGSLLCGVATSSSMLIIGRAVSGIGGSGITNGALTIIALCTPLEKRPTNIGIMMGISQLGIMLGPLVGGALTEHASWRWCFYINLPAGALVVGFLCFVEIPSPKHYTHILSNIRTTLKSLDLIGFVLFAPAAIMFLLALQWGGNAYRWDSATIIGLFCGAAGIFAIFLGWEYHVGDEAMIPFGMMKRKIIVTSCITMCLYAANMITTSYYLAIYFQGVRGISPLIAGVYILPSILSQMFTGVLCGFLVSRLGYYLPWVVGGTAVTAIGSGLMSTFTPTSSTGIWVGFQIISGLGRGAGLQIPVIAMQNNVKANEIPVAMSLLIFSQNIGASLFLSFAQTTFSNGLTNSLPIFAPGIDVQRVVDAGASGFRAVVAPSLLPSVLLAYNQAVSHVFYLTTGAVLGAFIACWGLGWKSVKKPKVVAPEA